MTVIGRRPVHFDRKRRWLRFSLRTIFVLVTLLLWLASLPNPPSCANSTGPLVASSNCMVRSHTGSRSTPTGIGNEMRSHWFQPGSAAGWARIISGVWPSSTSPRMQTPLTTTCACSSELDDVQQLSFSNCRKITDAGLSQLSNLASLKILVLDGTNVEGPGLRHLLPLQHLEGLTFSSTPLSDDGLEYLAAIPNLKWLHLNDTNITDDGLATSVDVALIGIAPIGEHACDRRRP